MAEEKKINISRNLWRLLGYTRKYWFRLTIGIISGLLVGSSLFVTLLMLPQLVGVVKDSNAPAVHVSAVERVPDSVALQDPELAKMAPRIITLKDGRIVSDMRNGVSLLEEDMLISQQRSQEENQTASRPQADRQ